MTDDDDGLRCYDCGLPYGDPGWCDAIIPDDIWLQISPRASGGGVLCLTCMARALEAKGLRDVPLQITSGPWQFDRDSIFTRTALTRAALRVRALPQDEHGHVPLTDALIAITQPEAGR